MKIDELDFLQAPRLQELQAQAESAQAEGERRKFLIMLVREIIFAINNKTIEKIEQGVDVNNLDEIKASLRNELLTANKPITELLKKLNLSTQEQTNVIKEIEKKTVEDFNNQYQTVIVKRVRDQVEVSNLHEISLPNDLRVNNLSELEEYFQNISNQIAALDLSVTLPPQQVTVLPTPITIPETFIPELDLSPLLKELEKGFKILRMNSKSNPLAVRLTDGGDWVKEFRAIAEGQKQAVQFMSDVSYIRDSIGNRINPATAEGQGGANTIGDGSKTVVTAGTRVQLTSTSTPCRYVIIVGNTNNVGKIYVGGITVSSSRGRPLNQEQSEKIDINDLSKVYIDAANNGDGVTYVFVA